MQPHQTKISTACPPCAPAHALLWPLFDPPAARSPRRDRSSDADDRGGCAPRFRALQEILREEPSVDINEVYAETGEFTEARLEHLEKRMGKDEQIARTMPSA